MNQWWRYTAATSNSFADYYGYADNDWVVGVQSVCLQLLQCLLQLKAQAECISYFACLVRTSCRFSCSWLFRFKPVLAIWPSQAEMFNTTAHLLQLDGVYSYCRLMNSETAVNIADIYIRL